MSFLYVDIETLPTRDPAVIAEIADGITPPKSMSKPETIASWEANDKPALVAEAVAKTSFSGLHGRICCIGWAFDDEPASAMIGHEGSTQEAAHLLKFANHLDTMRPQTIVGHNVAEFDIRFIRQRCLVHGIRLPTWFPSDPKPWDRSVFDTMHAWGGPRNPVSLDKLCRAFGIPGKQGFSGADVAGAWERGEYQRIADYCRDDVERVRAVHRKFQIVNGERAA